MWRTIDRDEVAYADVARSRFIEFDLGGVVAVRLVDAGPDDVLAVAGQLGLCPASVARVPEITIRFVDELERDDVVRYVGDRDAGATSERFIVLRGPRKSRVRAAVELAELGGRVTIDCERGAPAVPFLVPVVNVTALSRGVLPLHAAGFVVDGRGVLVTGWSKGGKTEALVAFGAHGARYVGDEWVYLDPRADRMFGLPEPIRLWDWHLQQLPALRRDLPASQRARLAVLRRAAASEGVVGRGPLRSLARRGAAFVRHQSYVDMPVTDVFGTEGVTADAPVDVVFITESHDSASIEVVQTEPAEVAARMVHSLRYERTDLWSLYDEYRYLFPGRRSEFLEHLSEIQRDLLVASLDDKPCWTVRHPRPFAFEEVYRAMAGVL